MHHVSHHLNKNDTCLRHQGDVLTDLLRQLHLANRHSEQQQQTLTDIATRSQRPIESSDEVGELAFPKGLITGLSSNDGHSSRKTNYQDSVFKLDISRSRKLSCKPFCSCLCHRRIRRKSPSITNKILGHLFLGYSSLPFIGPDCEEGCVQKAKVSATFTYYFPSWLVIRNALSLVMMTTQLGDLGRVIKVHKLTRDFSIFRFACVGDIAGIKRLLESRSVHPSAGFWGNWTSLHVCNNAPDSHILLLTKLVCDFQRKCVRLQVPTRSKG